MPSPARRLGPLVTADAAQAAPMHDRVIRHHRDHAAADAHAAAQTAMADHAQPLVRNGHVPVASGLRSAAPGAAVAEVQRRGDGDALGLAQRRHDARLVDHAVGRADAAAKVRLERAHGQVVGDEAERRRGGETRAVLGEQIERGLELRLVR